MAEMDERRGQLTVKIVYYGPALSGKTTNLVRLHDLLSAELIGDMMTLETQGDRTLFFDLLPVGFAAPSGLVIKFKLYTVPGQVAHDGTRKTVLSRADGVVFVADSQQHQAINNGAAFENLAANAAALGMDLSTLPLVVQFNKRDMPGILSEEEVRARWAGAQWPLFFASAMEGRGVLETFSALLAQVYARLDQAYGLGEVHGLTQDAFIAAVGRPA